MTHSDTVGAGTSPPSGTTGGTGPAATVTVGGFPLAVDRRYDPATHLWVADVGSARVRVGVDALGVEINGTLAQLSLPQPGAEVLAGRPFGQVEAAKFVGPLVSPVSGRVTAVNEDAAADPGRTERDPYGTGWLVEIELRARDCLPAALLADPEEITRWFTAEVERYRRTGVIAE